MLFLALSPPCAPPGALPNWATTNQHSSKTRPDTQPPQQASPVPSIFSGWYSSHPSRLLHRTVQEGDESALPPPDTSRIQSLPSHSSEGSNVSPPTSPYKASRSPPKTMESVKVNDDTGTTAQEVQLLKQRIESLEKVILSLQANQRLHDHRITSLEKQRDDKFAYVAGVGSNHAGLSFRPQELSVAETRKDQTPCKAQSQAATQASALRSSSIQSVDSILFGQSADNALTPRGTGQQSAAVRTTSSGSLLDDEKYHGLDAPVLTPTRSLAKPTVSREDTSSTQDLLIIDSPSATKKLPVWDGKIHWAMDRLFDNEIEELKALTNPSNELPNHGRLADQWVFQYGLRYKPEPDESNVYRTVKIEELPLDVRMDQVLSQVCCGDVFSAQLLNTKEITGYHTAIVIFLQQRQAENFARYAATEGIFINGTRLKVTVVNTPTYPMSTELETLIWHEGYTRCVALYNFREELMDVLQFVIQRSICGNYIECIEDGWNENEICIRFHSIKIAAKAYDLLTAHPSFLECRIGFVPDPCTRAPK